VPVSRAESAKTTAHSSSACDSVKEELEKYSDWDVNIMLAIAKAESSCKVNAVGDTNITYNKNGRTYGYSVGAFQVRILPGREKCDTHNVVINVKCAHDIFKSQGLKAWSVFNNMKYRRYL